MPEESDEITVRQTPLTAIDSPGVSSGASDVINPTRRPAGVGLTSATSPTFSTIPVNISGVFQSCRDQHVRSEPLGASPEEHVPRKVSRVQPLNAVRSDPALGDVDVHSVHNIGMKGGTMQSGASLDHERGH